MYIKNAIIIMVVFCLIVCTSSCNRESPVAPTSATPNPVIESGTAINIISGNNQKGDAGERLKDLIVISIANKEQAFIGGADISFSVISGGGSISNQVVKSNSMGRASVAWTTGIGPEQILKVYVSNESKVNPIYIYANNQLEIKTKWITGLDFYAYSTKYNHDNRILESNNFLTFSDGAGDDVKIIYSKMAEESFFELKQLFNIKTSEEIGISSENTSGKIKIYSIKNENFDQMAFSNGFILYGMDSRPYKNWGNDDFWFRREIKHETVHVLQFLFGLEFSNNRWTEVWFTEGIAEYISGGAFSPITSNNQWKSWLGGSGHLNPVKIHQWSDFPIPYERTGEYYPAFGLAVKYLLDKKGLGKNYNDIKAMFMDILITCNFKTSFEKYMGISVDYYEKHFIDIISEFLNKQ